MLAWYVLFQRNVLFMRRFCFCFFVCFLEGKQNDGIARVQKVRFGSATEPRSAPLMRGCGGMFVSCSPHPLSQKDEFSKEG